MFEGIRTFFSRSEGHKDLSWRDARRLRAAARVQSALEWSKIGEQSQIDPLDMELGIDPSFYRNPDSPDEKG